MTSILTATAVSGGRARIVWAPDPADPAGTVTLVRTAGTLGDQAVMGASNVPNLPDQWDDPEVPLGVPTVWKIRTSTGLVVTSNPVTVDGPPIAGMGGAPGAIVSDPVRGVSAVVVVLGEHVTTSRVSRAQAVDVEGRASRVIITHVEAASTRTPKLLTETLDAAQTMDEMLAPGRAVLLRASCPGVPDEWLQLVAGRTIAWFSDATSPVRVHTLGETEVLTGNPNPELRALGDTLGDIDIVSPATLDAISARWASLGEIAAADLKGMMA